MITCEHSSGVLVSRDATLRLVFLAAGLLQFLNGIFVALAVPETHRRSTATPAAGLNMLRLLQSANPLGFTKLFLKSKRLSILTVAIGLSSFSDQEKDLKSIFRKEVLQWSRKFTSPNLPHN